MGASGDDQDAHQMSLTQARLKIDFVRNLSRICDAPRNICVLGRFEVLENLNLEGR